MRKQATDWERTYIKNTSDKGLLSRLYKKTLKTRKKNHLTKKLATDQNRHLTKETQMANKHIKMCSISYVIKSTQMKTTRRSYHITSRIATPRTLTPPMPMRMWTNRTLIRCLW